MGLRADGLLDVREPTGDIAALYGSVREVISPT